MQLAIVLVFLSSALGALADCCLADNGCYVVGNELICPYCDDGTLGTPCCGYGPCNIFCCNCDGGMYLHIYTRLLHSYVDVFVTDRLFSG